MLEDIQGDPTWRHEQNIQFSEYYATLDDAVKVRYKEKVTLCGFDPYQLKKSDYSEDFKLFPNVEYPDIINYLVLQTSWATSSQMKAYKSTEGYNFFVSGWVNTLLVKKVGTNKAVVSGRVSKIQYCSYIIFNINMVAI